MATIDTECLELLIGSCVALKKLSLENCQVNDKICHMLAYQNHQTLDTLHLAMVTGISTSGAFSIVKKCKKLTELNLGWTNLKESTFDVISSEFSRSLKKLNLSGHRDSLNDDHLEAIVDSCPNLVELDISDW
jgi:F-box and leucine-rich repeat protein 1 (S-phase kinase-associated protein 2)